MSTSIDVSLMLLQLVALTIPPVVVLLQMLRRSQNLNWRFRKASFGLVFGSIGLLLGAAIAVLTYFVTALQLAYTLYAALGFVILGLLPLALFVGVLYREHREEFGP